MLKIKASKALIEALKKNEVKYVFGLPGTTEVPFLDALAETNDIEYILSLHESICVGIADGYARASKNVGFVNVHSTPGTLNALSFLYNAYKDNSPLIVTAGDIDTRLMIKEPFLWIQDLHAIVKPFTKWSWVIKEANEIPNAIRRAFKIALTPPRGPVYLNFPKNLLDETIEIDEKSIKKDNISFKVKGDENQLKKVAKLLIEAKLPLIIAGNEVANSNAINELIELCELLAIPVFSEPNPFFTVSMNFPHSHPLYIGVYNYNINSDLINFSDIIFGIGCKMFIQRDYSPIEPIPKNALIIHLHNDPWEIGKNYPVDFGIFGDIKLCLKIIIDYVKSFIDNNVKDKIKERIKVVEKVKEQINALRDKKVKEEWDSLPIKPSRLIKELKETMPKSSIIVEESITSTSFLEHYFEFNEIDSLYGESGGSLGWGLPAALGVKLANPSRPVIALIGDGSFLFSLQALWTASKYNIPVIAIIFNNSSYMAVKSALLNYDGVCAHKRKFIGCDLFPPSIEFVELAKGFNVYGEKIKSPEEIKPALKNALNLNKPVLLDVILDPKERGFYLSRIP